jgi:hypothetical protein
MAVIPSGRTICTSEFAPPLHCLPIA